MAKKSKQSKTLPIYILNGPNLNLLGTREPEVYGYTTLAQVEQIQEARTASCGLIINPAGYGHTSIAILDSIQMLKVPVIEVHLSNIHRREPYRNHSYVSKGATGIVMGLGAQGYLRAIDAVAEILSSKSRSK